MVISLSELKANPGKYFEVNEDAVAVTKNGKLIGHIVPTKKDKVAAAKSLIGILPKGIDTEKILEERYK